MKKTLAVLFCVISLLFTTGIGFAETSRPVLTEIAEIKEKTPFSTEETEMLRYIVQQEVRGASLKHKRIIVNVVLNRVNSADFPDNIPDVLFQKGQFTSAENCINKRYPPDEDTKKAVHEVLNNECEDLSQGALYFYAPRWTDEKIAGWFEENLTFLFELEGHRFFK